MNTRYARIESASDSIAAYLPSNYRIVKVVDGSEYRTVHTIIAGEDNCGWTLDDYVLPRLASGMYFGREIFECEHGVTPTEGDCAECAVASGEWRFTETGEMERVSLGEQRAAGTLSDADAAACDAIDAWAGVSKHGGGGAGR